ncbi:DUF2807 domain-containing protein [bacterium]|nr:DUF2807 domain-containing protein [bacterium]MDC1221980.1 DUF2807 domain-containing protein [Salibacteraceae bacterium]
MKTLNTLTLGIAIAAISFSTTSCKKDKWPYCTKANGKMTTETRTLDSFTKIEVEGEGDVFLHQITKETSHSIEIEASANIMDRIKTEVKNGKLIIGSDCIRGNEKMNFTVYVADLSAMSISGSGSATTMTPFTVNDLDLEIEGSGDMDMDVTGRNMTCDISGSGDIKMNGTATDFDIEIDGSGDIHAFNLISQDCFIDISGSGNCEVYVDGELNVKISGSGDVLYDGTPTSFTTDISGSGDVSKR